MARSCGLASRRELYDRLTAAELLEWEALYAMDPWGPLRADVAMGTLCSLTDACHRSRGQPASPEEYMPYLRDGQRATQTVDDMKAILTSAGCTWTSPETPSE